MNELITTNKDIKAITMKDPNDNLKYQVSKDNLIDNVLFNPIILCIAAGVIRYISLQRENGKKIIIVDTIMAGCVAALSGIVLTSIGTYFSIPTSVLVGFGVLLGWQGPKLLNELSSALSDGLVSRLKDTLLTFVTNKKTRDNKDSDNV